MNLMKSRDASARHMGRTFRGLSVRGGPFSVDDNSSVIHICGDIGAVHPPVHYAHYPTARIYVLCNDEREVIGYAAVRLARFNNFVLDAFGILEERRAGGIGRRLYWAIEADIAGPWASATGSFSHTTNGIGITISVQATYEYDSYVAAVRRHSRETNGGHAITLDMDAIARELRGSCVFWRRMGFNNQQLVCASPASLFTPIMLMWHNM